MCYKVKMLFNIQRSWLKRLVFYITSSMTLEKLRCPIPPAECLKQAISLMCVGRKQSLNYLLMAVELFSLQMASGALTVIGLFGSSSEVGTFKGSF